MTNNKSNQNNMLNNPMTIIGGIVFLIGILGNFISKEMIKSSPLSYGFSALLGKFNLEIFFAQYGIMIGLVGLAIAVVGFFITKSNTNANDNKQTSVTTPDGAQTIRPDRSYPSNNKEMSPESKARKEVFEEQLKADPLNTDIMLKYSRFLNENEVWDKSLSPLLKILTIKENDSEAQLLLFQSYINLGELKNALEIGGKLIPLKKDDVSFLNDLSDIYFKLDKLPESVKYLDEYIKIQSSNKEVWRKKAKIHSLLEEEDKELISWEQVYKLDPDDLISRINIGVASGRKGDFNRAKKLLEKIVEEVDSTYDKNTGYLYFAKSLMELNEPEETIEKLLQNKIEVNKVIQQKNETDKNVLAELYFYLGESKLTKGEHEKAIQFLEQSRSLGREESKLNLAAAWSLAGKDKIESGSLEEARNLFEKAIQFDSETAEYRDLLQRVQSKLKSKKGRFKALAACIVFLIAAGIIVWYCAHGDLELNINSESNITILHGNEVIADLKNTKNISKEFLTIGEYDIHVSSDGYEPYEKKLKITWLSKTYEQVDLNPIFGALKINSKPSNIDVFIDGIKKGKTPLTIKELLAKITNVELKKDGYYRSEKINVIKNETLNIGTPVLKFSLSNLTPQQILKPNIKKAAYYADFEKNNGGWDKKKSENSVKEIKNGELHYTQNGYFYYEWNAEKKSFADFWYGAYMRKTSQDYHDEYYGIVFRGGEAVNSYSERKNAWSFFGVNDRGEYIVRECTSSCGQLHSGKTGRNISGKKIHLAVESIGGDISLFIDGKLLASLKSFNSAGRFYGSATGGVGIGVGRRIAVAYDDLYVSEIPYLWKPGKLLYKESFNSPSKETKEKFKSENNKTNYTSFSNGKLTFSKGVFDNFHYVDNENYSLQVDTSAKGKHATWGVTLLNKKETKYDGKCQIRSIRTLNPVLSERFLF